MSNTEPKELLDSLSTIGELKEICGKKFLVIDDETPFETFRKSKLFKNYRHFNIKIFFDGLEQITEN